MKANVTPTRITLSGPEPESKIRILRMFPGHTDYLLRVLFCDDDGQDLLLNPKISNEKVYERYRRVLRDGIKVAGRQFSFLGYSASCAIIHLRTSFDSHRYFVNSCRSRHVYEANSLHE